MARKQRAVDLYSGVGGWSIGMRLAGIETVGSYEWWQPAVETNSFHSAHVHLADVRALHADQLPADIDVLVGSPPCTQFSFSNRGGKGDIQEGLRDIEAFLRLVEETKPKHWAMENVPRVAKILDFELGIGGSLERYAHLFRTIAVVDTSRLGLPQRRKRMIAGNFDGELFRSYFTKDPKSLSLVIDTLADQPVIDPHYGIQCSREELADMEMDWPLAGDELRMNRDNKSNHPVYNFMEFPDRLDEPSRTITATCTRMTRESIIVLDPNQGYRRLKLRERAVLQTFPIDMPFAGKTFNERLKLIGNAIPPALAHAVADAFLEIPAEDRLELHQLADRLPRFTGQVQPAPPPKPRRRYPATRTFRAAIPVLNFRSGVRFELLNTKDGRWKIQFGYGHHLDVRFLNLESTDLSPIHPAIAASIARAGSLLDANSELNFAPEELQAHWSSWDEQHGPYRVVDVLDRIAFEFEQSLTLWEVEASEEIVRFLEPRGGKKPRPSKLQRNARLLYVGCVLGCAFNQSRRSSTQPNSESIANPA